MKGYKAGPRLTLKTARELALKVTGTAKGLAKDKTLAFDLYEMQLGELSVKVKYDWFDSGCILVAVDGYSNGAICMLFNAETLERDYEAEDRQRTRDRRESLKEWVESRGPDACKADIDRIWNQQ